jgi:uncharacterized membrane protein YesL
MCASLLEQEVRVQFPRSLREYLDFLGQHLLPITLVTVAWLLLQVPVITGPAATIGLFYFARQALLQDDARVQGFGQGMTKFFWKSWLIVLPYALLAFFFAYDLAFLLVQQDRWARLLASIPAAVAGLVLFLLSYVFVFFVRENGTVGASVRWSFRLVAADPLVALALLLATLVYFLLLLMTKILPALLFVGPVAVAQTMAVRWLLTRRGIEF